VDHAKNMLKKAPDVQAGTDLATSTVAEAAEHYGVTLPGGELESGARRKQLADADAKPAGSIGRSMELPQLRQITLAVSDIRAIVLCAPQWSHSERSSKRWRQLTQR
jgi:hypothetical protein